MTYELVIGESIGPFRLGIPVDEALAHRDDWEVEERGPISVYGADGWLLFAEDGVLTQVGAQPPLQVRGPHGLRLGGTLDEIEVSLVFDRNDEVLSLDDTSGLTIDVERDSGDEDEELSIDMIHADMVINWLGVHIPEDAPDYVELWI